MVHQFVNIQFSKLVFASFLGIGAFTFLNMYRPKYYDFFYFANVKRLWSSQMIFCSNLI